MQCMRLAYVYWGVHAVLFFYDVVYIELFIFVELVMQREFFGTTSVLFVSGYCFVKMDFAWVEGASRGEVAGADHGKHDDKARY